MRPCEPGLPARHALAAIALTAFALLLSGCAGKDYGGLQRLDLTTPGPTGVTLDVVRAFESAAARENTYAIYRNGKEEDEPSVRALRPAPEGATRWRAEDTEGNWLAFQFDRESGVRIFEAFNDERNGWVRFDPPLGLFPAEMRQGEEFTYRSDFAAWTDDRTTRTGTIEFTSWLAGIEDLETPMGTLSGCPRIDSRIKVSLPFGFGAWINQRQWLHPTWGEVCRDVDGAFGFAEVRLGSFTSRQIVTESRPAIIETARDQRDSPTDPGA